MVQLQLLLANDIQEQISALKTSPSGTVKIWMASLWPTYSITMVCNTCIQMATYALEMDGKIWPKVSNKSPTSCSRECTLGVYTIEQHCPLAAHLSPEAPVLPDVPEVNPV